MAPETLLAPARPQGTTRRPGGPTGHVGLRVLDFGTVSALRSQSLWHALAHGVGRGGPATVALCRPASPYVSLGYHRDLAEVDLGACSARQLPVLRRMVGGGTVYLDQDQLFFQLVVPPDTVPAVRSRAVATLLAPVRDAFAAAGLPARFDHDELTAAGRKLCGHGAGLVGGAVVVVGNLIERFDADAASAVLAVPDERTRARLRRRMAMHVGPPPGTPVDATAFARRLIEAARELLGPPAGGGIHGALGQGGDLGQGGALGQAGDLGQGGALGQAGDLGQGGALGQLSPFERRILARFDRLLGSTAFLAGPRRLVPAGDAGQQGHGESVWAVKVRAGVAEGRARCGSTVLRAAVVDRCLRDVEIDDGEVGPVGGPAGGLRAIAVRLEGLGASSSMLAELEQQGSVTARAVAAARLLLDRVGGGLA